MRSYEGMALMRQMSEQTAECYPEMSSKTTLISTGQDLTCKDDSFLHDEKENVPPNILVSEFPHEAFHLPIIFSSTSY